jgi:serine/threonine-protein kinase
MTTHRSIHRRIATTGAVLTAGLSAAAVAGPAQAASNPYTPQGVCGAGFGVIDHHELRSGKVQLGTVYLLYQASSGRNCVVTMKERGVGRKTPTAAFLQRQGAKTAKIDYRRYAYYAGPRRVKAAGRCVLWGGGIKVGKRVAAYRSTFEHCG